jgi:hypothetical protein
MPRKTKKLSTSTKSVTLKLTQEQAGVVESALEVYARIHLGQFWVIGEQVFPKADNYEKRNALDKIGRSLYLPELQLSSTYGIFSPAVPDSARTAWSIQKTIRFCRSWAKEGINPATTERDWSKYIGVNYDTPTHGSGLPAVTYEDSAIVSYPFNWATNAI